MLKVNLNIKKKNYFEILYILFLGIITSLSLTPYNYWFVNFFTFSFFFIFLLKNKNKNLKSFFIYGYVFGFGYFISSLYWIAFSLSYDEKFAYLIPFAVVLIPAFLSLFYGVALGLYKFFFNSKSIFANILAFSFILSFFDFLRGNVLSGFPWNLFAYSFLENIYFIQINSLIGVYAFNLFLITLFSAPSVLFLNRKKNDLIGVALIFITSICIYIYGGINIKNFNNKDEQTLNSNIKILSTKIPLERFYSIVDDEEILIKLIDLSDPNLNENTIFIWPEGIMPSINLKQLTEDYNYLFEKSFSENHFIILGINDDIIVDGKKKYYNSLSIIDNKASTLYKYYKNKLVPFGEFLPIEKVLSKLGLKSLTNNYQSYSSSKERKIFDFGTNTKILPLICYEIIYSGKLSENYDFNFIINISEDGWFGNSIGPYQHFAHTIFRSIEHGKYTLRSANNGISAIIDPTGAVIDEININNEGVISINEIKNVNETLFSKYGNKMYFLIILLYIFLIFLFMRLKNE
tara:strand:+ start:2804 stop:4360 length:1557 start_codon:yes stop_codon:yes gene_type:complete